MNTPQRVVIMGAIVLIVLSVLFPPYAAGILPVGKNIHSGIGFHPIWKPPSVEYAYERLHDEKYDPAAGVDLSGYFVMFNKVGFIFRLIAILLVSSIMFFIFKKRKKSA
jgi:hypothetical protein